jgi:hypothetical protein
MAKMKLVIATPVRAAEMGAASVSLGYAEMLNKIFRLLPTSETLAGSITFSCDIVRGRNRIAAKILREIPEATHVLWVDDDQWCEDVNIITEMMNLGVDVVGAPYTNKRQPLHWVHRNLTPQACMAGDLLEVAGVGFGFTLTSVSCLKRMSEVERKYTDHPNPHKVANIFGHLFDHPLLEKGVAIKEEDQALLSEDYSFCLRARKLGIPIHIYVKGGIVYHAGSHAWTAREMPGGVIG